MKRIHIIILFFGIIFSSHAQIGGEATYQFLGLHNSARSSALANTSIGVWDSDLSLSISNPSLLDSSMTQHMSLNYANYIADINYGSAAYAHHFDKIGTFAFAINYFNYGDFKEADATGAILGEFTAADYAFNLIYARALLPNLQMGVNLKFLYSDYYQYFSSGIALDAGLTYHNDDKKRSLALVVKNFGTQIKTYREDNYEELPFDVQIGFAQRLNHAPFRFLIALHHLNNWDMRYDSPLDQDNKILGNEEPKEKSKIDQFGDEAIRHLNLGVELVPGKNFYLRAGYNFQRLKELTIDDKYGMVGFSFGAGIRIYKFHISYGRAIYHVAGATNTFSITSNLSEFF